MIFNLSQNSADFQALSDRIQVLESLLAVVSNPTFKQKRVVGIAGAAGSSTAIPHGLDSSKIIGVSAIGATLNGTASGAYPSSIWSDGEFGWYYDLTNIYFDLSATNSVGFVGKAFVFLITYLA